MKINSILLAAIPFTDALICWECDNAKSMEDCKAQKRARKCNSNEKSCQQEIRTWGPGGKYMSITQRCKQRHACVNNHIQNPRAAWKNSQCQPIRHPENSVCRCCCTHNYCNGKEYAGCRGQEFMEPATTSTLAPTTIADIVGIDVDDTYGELGPSEGTNGENGAINFAGMTGEGDAESDEEPAVTTVAPPEDENQGGTSKGEGEGNEFGFSIVNQGQTEPECEWAGWSEWDKCSETCGGGQRNRYRAPIGGNIGDTGCEGLNEEVQYCNTRDCEDKKCNDNYLDVCFLVHISDETSNKQMGRIRKFLKGCQNHLGDFGSEDMQMCLYQYNSDVQQIFSLEESSIMSKQDFQQEINDFVPLSGSGNDVNGALNAIRDYGFSKQYGWRANNQIPSILVVVTDDLLTQDHYNSFLDVQDKTFRVVAVGIGDDVDADALNLMASLPSSENTHKITSFDNLPDIAQEVAYDVCQVDHWVLDQCRHNNGGCAAGEMCVTQYNGIQCYPPAN